MVVAALGIQIIRLLAIAIFVKAEACSLSACTHPLHRARQLASADLLWQPLGRLVIVGHAAATPRLLCRRLGTAGRVLVEPLGRRCVDGRRALVTEYRVLHRLGQFDEPTMPMIRMRDANAFYLPCTGLHVRSDMVRVNRSRRCCRRLSLVLGSCTRLRNPIRGVLLAAFAMVLLES